MAICASKAALDKGVWANKMKVAEDACIETPAGMLTASKFHPPHRTRSSGKTLLPEQGILREL